VPAKFGFGSREILPLKSAVGQIGSKGESGLTESPGEARGPPRLRAPARGLTQVAVLLGLSDSGERPRLTFADARFVSRFDISGEPNSCDALPT